MSVIPLLTRRSMKSSPLPGDNGVTIPTAADYGNVTLTTPLLTQNVFELGLDIIKTNVLTKVLTRFINFGKTAPPNGAEISNVLAKFHENLTLNVACRVFTIKILTTHHIQHAKGDHKNSS
ncbi:hypothetical protein DPMN_030526 [Dreissena polymorpha]|uniref:Uncharacterized protein n=1 Tax=Dreissena polymorpha TaxID=45954 RepID=A0A9D4M042_DREPO|nr:hypothetical protein DPMN_030526 [Dreissena polymorpha]